MIWYEGKLWRAHRLAYHLQGLDVPLMVDHINGITDDNRWINLRSATTNQNAYNSVKRSKHRRGAHYNKATDQWYSSIRVEGQRVYLGTFPNEDAAAEAYKAAQLIHHKDYRREYATQGGLVTTSP